MENAFFRCFGGVLFQLQYGSVHVGSVIQLHCGSLYGSGRMAPRHLVFFLYAVLCDVRVAYSARALLAIYVAYASREKTSYAKMKSCILCRPRYSASTS